MTPDWYFVLMIGLVALGLLGYGWATAEASRLSLGAAAATLMLLSLALAVWARTGGFALHHGGGPMAGRSATVDPGANLALIPPIGWPDKSPMDHVADHVADRADVENARLDSPVQSDPTTASKLRKAKPVRAKPKSRSPIEPKFPYQLPTSQGCSTGNNRLCP